MPLKVLQLCAVDFTLARFIAPLCFRLQDQGFEVTAACTESVFLEPLRRRGLRCVDLPIERSLSIGAHLRSYRRLSQWLSEEHFDVIHVHTPIASLIGRVAGARRGVPIRLYTAHGFYFHDEMPFLKRTFHVGLEWFGSFFHDFLFTQSEEDRQAAIRYHLGKPGEVRTIGNGVDLSRFDPDRFTADDRVRTRAALGIGPDARVLGIIGRLVREKGYFELFQASVDLARRFPDFLLLVIGDALPSDHDDSTAELQSRVDGLGLRDRIVFAGQREDVPELLHAMDVYTLPSWREGMPRSVIEAMAMSLPCVVTNIRGCREEVVDHQTGFIVPVRDPKALSEKCADLLADPEKARKLGAAGRARARQLYSEQEVFERQIEVYRQLIEEKGLEAGD
ncbi:glycosyltransferase family 4 protein [bacterium]|nr:glycosyltransferase family 4 protein [bacterium]